MVDNIQDKLYQEVGRNIKKFRNERKMNQLSLASQINLSRTSLVNIEHGRQHPSLYLLFQIAYSLGVSLHDLIPNSLDLGRNTYKSIPSEKTKEEKVLFDFIKAKIYPDV